MPDKTEYSILSGQLESRSMAEKGVRAVPQYGGHATR
jgi:hypothetical protein